MLAWANLGVIREHEGDFPEARDLYTRSKGLAHELGLESHARSCIGNVAETYIKEGDTARAAALLAEAHPGFDAEFAPGHEALYLDLQGQLLAADGRFDEALRVLERARGEAERHPHDGRWYRVMMHLAEIHAEYGSMMEARRYLREVESRGTPPAYVRPQHEALVQRIRGDRTTTGSHSAAPGGGAQTSRSKGSKT